MNFNRDQRGVYFRTYSEGSTTESCARYIVSTGMEVRTKKGLSKQRSEQRKGGDVVRRFYYDYVVWVVLIYGAQTLGS